MTFDSQSEVQASFGQLFVIAFYSGGMFLILLPLEVVIHWKPKAIL